MTYTQSIQSQHSTSLSNAQVFNISGQTDHQQEDRTGFKPLQSCCCCCKSTQSLSVLVVSDWDPHMDQRISYDVLTNNYSFSVRPQPVQFIHRGYEDRSKNKASREYVCFAAPPVLPGPKTDKLFCALRQFCHHCSTNAQWADSLVPSHPLHILSLEPSLWVLAFHSAHSERSSKVKVIWLWRKKSWISHYLLNCLQFQHQ